MIILLSFKMEGVESFDVFTILNRLTQISSADKKKSD